jgi:hypothetical protein
MNIHMFFLILKTAKRYCTQEKMAKQHDYQNET